MLEIGRVRVVVQGGDAAAALGHESLRVESRTDALLQLGPTFPVEQPLWRAIFDLLDDLHVDMVVTVDDNTFGEWTVLRVDLTFEGAPPAKPSWIRRHDYVLQHFEAALVNTTTASITPEDFDLARACECHVVGCRVHAPSTAALLKKHSFNLPSLFKSLESPLEAAQMHIRPDRSYLDRLTQGHTLALTDLPMNAIWVVLKYLNARDIAVMSMVNSLLQHVTYDTVPGLHLTLFPHQKKALKWMMYRESLSIDQLLSKPHPYVIQNWIDPVCGRVVPAGYARDSRGGFLCDEPGLGKTITMISLLLRTQGTVSRPDEGDSFSTTTYKLRSKHHSGRRVATSQLRPSRASLIIVPDTLMAHWSYQLEMHTTGLQVLLDTGKKVPDAAVLELYDVVVTSFGRLATHWLHHRPLSALESRAPERLGSENQRNYADGVEHKSLSPFMELHWVRIIVDEGHKLGGTAITNAMQMLCSLSADKRWIMTGTPTPHIAQTDGLRHLHGLLRFLQELPYGSSDDKPWLNAIAKPFEAKCVKGYLRLERLLNRIMLRHVKSDVAAIPPPIFITTVVDPTPVEFRIYNAVVGVVRGNLIVTKWDPQFPGPLHKDSLLNPDNRKDAMTAVSNLRLASCGGGTMEVLLSREHYVETINFFDQFQMDWDRRLVVQQYMRDAQDGTCTPCEVCRHELQFVMVTVCGHLVCADCIEQHVDAHGFEPNSMRTTCPVCQATFDWEQFQELQPGFDYKWTADEAIPTLSHPALPATRPPRHQLQPSVPGLDDDDDHIWASSKGLYVLERIQSLLGIGKRPMATKPCVRPIKCIVFSDFQEHIYRIRPDFARAGLRFVSFLSGEAKMSSRLEQLRHFRDNDDVHVLFMTEIGAIGLDLSFVTHIFLMDEIWDKSLEKQVVARAHRMGATESVVVEQLEMRGSMEALVREFYAVPQHLVTAERHPKEGKSHQKKAKTKQTKSLFRVVNKESMSSLRLYHVLNNVRMIDGHQASGGMNGATSEQTNQRAHGADDDQHNTKRARIGGD